MPVTVTISTLGSGSLTVRGLLNRVGTLRPDVLSVDEAQVITYIMDAVRRICRETGMAREVQLPVGVLAGTEKVQISASTGRDLLRIVRVRTGMPSYSAVHYAGSWNASTNTPTLTATPETAGNFYIVSNSGSTSLGGVSDWQAGDLIVSNGATWEKLQQEDFHTAWEANKPSTEQFYDQPQKLTGGANFKWTQEAQYLYLYPRPSKDCAVELVASFVPVGDFDSIPLPNEAEDCIVALARYELMLHPFKTDPENANSDMAMRHADRFKKEYKSLLGELRGVADYGYSGSAQYDPGTIEAGWP